MGLGNRRKVTHLVIVSLDSSPSACWVQPMLFGLHNASSQRSTNNTGMLLFFDYQESYLDDTHIVLNYTVSF